MILLRTGYMCWEAVQNGGNNEKQKVKFVAYSIGNFMYQYIYSYVL